jgi:DNA-directed RNA polymerase specialized sigma24 family protein
MRVLWQSLHDKLLQSIDTITFKKRFGILRASQPVLQRFPDHYALLDHLHGPTGDLDDKDRILAILLTTAGRAGPMRETAMTLSWLALWPGLDALYRRLWRHFAKAPEELVSEISVRFTAVVSRFDESRVRRVAATVLRNVERLIRDDLRSEWERSSRTVSLSDEEPVLGPLTPQPCCSASSFGIPPGADADAATEMLRVVLTSLLGPVAELVIAVAVVGQLQSEAASGLAIAPDAARKRYQRAVARLRMQLEAA